MCWDFRLVPPHPAKSPLQLPKAVTAVIIPSFSFAAPAFSPGPWLPRDSRLVTSRESSLLVSFSLCALLNKTKFVARGVCVGVSFAKSPLFLPGEGSVESALRGANL